jgi:hypothetical protein
MERYRPGLSDLQTLDSGSQASMLKVDSLAYEWFCLLMSTMGVQAKTRSAASFEDPVTCLQNPLQAKPLLVSQTKLCG